MCSKNEISNRNVIVEISSTERNEFTNNIKDGFSKNHLIKKIKRSDQYKLDY